MGRDKQALELSGIYELKTSSSCWSRRSRDFMIVTGLLKALQIRNNSLETLLYFFSVMKNLPTFFRSRTICPIVFVSPWSAGQPSAPWMHLRNVHLKILSTRGFHVHSCHLIYTGTGKYVNKSSKDETATFNLSFTLNPRRATWRKNVEVSGY